MRAFEAFLKVEGWASGYRSVQRLLDHLARQTKSESSRRHYLETLCFLCRREGKDPDQLAAVAKAEAEGAVQSYLDRMMREDRSVRYVNTSLHQLETFFRSNGFRKEGQLDIEGYHQPTRYRKREEYIPTDEEVLRMANHAGSPKARALVLAAYMGGFRNATLRAIRYGEVKSELAVGYDVVCVRVTRAMKEVDPDAAKNSIEYVTFVGREAADAMRAFVREYEARHGPLPPEWPLFVGQRPGRPVKRRTLEVLVKGAARRASVEGWRAVTPHSLRKAFERAVRNAGLDTKDQEFFMGHVLPYSQDAYYDKTKVEELRQKYRRVRFFPGSDPQEVRKQAARDQLKILEALEVLPREEIEAMRGLLEKKRIEEIDWKEMVAQLRREAGPRGHRSVPPEEAEGLMEEGWRWVGNLPNGKVVLEPPSQARRGAAEAPRPLLKG